MSPNDFDFTGAASLGQQLATHALAVARTASAGATDAPIISTAWEDYTFAMKPVLRMDKACSCQKKASGNLAGR